MRPRPHVCPAALAFMSASHPDIRPQIVALYFGDIQTGLPVVLAYGVAYLSTWCERHAVSVTQEVVRAAVAHGLLRLWQPTKAGPTDNRAKQAGMRAGVFRLLSNTARDCYRRRLTEGAQLFVEVAADSEDPRRNFNLRSPWPESAWWNRLEAGRPSECRSVEWKVGNRDRSPASDPRVPPRDTGWLPNLDRAA